ncbi:polysaccharide deacetylase family protein [bacterium]|nr:polysaccharide deacetylase family protein [bacterium]
MTSRKLYLTFDDGPHPTLTPSICTILMKHQIPATFFVRGDRIRKYNSLFKDFDYNLFQLGYHGLSHTPWWFKSRPELQLEMFPTNDFLNLLDHNPLTPPPPMLLRPPYGRFGVNALSQVAKSDARLVLWRLVLGDWLPGHTTNSLQNLLLEHVRGGDIIVLHDGGINGKLLPSLLQSVIPILEDRGFSFENLDDLLMDSTQ